MEFNRGYVYEYKTSKGQRRFFYQVKVGRNKNGYIKYKKKGGFRRERDAKAALAKLQTDMMMGTYKKDVDVTFEVFALDWFENTNARVLGGSQYLKKKMIIEKHLLSSDFAYKKMSEIKTNEIDAFYSKKLNDGLSSSYVIDMRIVINQIFERASDLDVIRKNPTEKTEKIKLVRKEKEVWNKEEIDKFLSATKDERLHHAFLLMTYAGVRRGEVLALRWKDVDLEDRILHIRQAWKKDNNAKRFIGSPKSGRARALQISKSVSKELKTLKEKRKEEAEKRGVKLKEDDFIITNTLGKTQDPSQLAKVKKRITERIGIKNITNHEMRHSHASLLLENKVSVKKVQNRLGHANPSVTLDVYSHIVDEIDDTGDVFENIGRQ